MRRVILKNLKNTSKSMIIESATTQTMYLRDHSLSIRTRSTHVSLPYLGICIFALCTFINSVAHASLYEDRSLYKAAIQALQANRITQFEQHVAALGEYPLVPYLEYRRALLRVNRTNAAAMIAYRDSASAYTFGDRFLEQWLHAQAANGRWQTYVEHYQPTTNVIARCRYALGLLRTGNKQEAYRLLPELWNVEKSQHKSCDKAFGPWIRDGGVTAELAWQRLQKTLDARQYQLSRYLLNFLPDQVKPSGQMMYEVSRNPHLVTNISRFRNDRWGNDALLYGLLRVARNDGSKANSLWQKYHDSRKIDSNTERAFVSELYLWLGLDGHVGLPHREGLSTAALERVIHAAISQNAWQEADRWVQELPDEDLAKYEWRFWRASIDQALGRERWQEEMQSLAAERTYYGFLAAQLLGLPINLNEQHYQPNSELENQLTKHPRARMVFEFFAVDEPTNGRREWRKFETTLNDAEKMVMIHWFNEYGLSHEAIWAANRSEMLNFLAVRFPSPFLSYFKQGAFVADVPLEFLLALSRQESAFDHQAISRAGARGLMQMMLPTAQATAANNGISRPTADTLLDPRRNIELGSYHVAELAAEFANNRVLIAASYNAGKNRIYAWLREYPVQDAASFIEMMPIRETREYVKGVLAFSVVYAARSGKRPQILFAHELQLPSHLRN